MMKSYESFLMTKLGILMLMMTSYIAYKIATGSLSFVKYLWNTFYYGRVEIIFITV